MNKLSTGDPSTLGSYLRLTEIVFGKDSAPAKYIKDKIAKSPNGENEEVLADERQMISVLTGMFISEHTDRLTKAAAQRDGNEQVS